MKEFIAKAYPDLEASGSRCHNFKLKLEGKKVLNISEIKAVLRVTGLTFEEAFQEEKED